MEEDLEPARFGRGLRHLFSLDPHVATLNHGSYGAVPLVVQAAQEAERRRMESGPDAFFRSIFRPDDPDAPLRRIAALGARLMNVPGESVALVENATTGVQAVLNGLQPERGDEILITDHGYRAVRLGIEALCRRTGAVPRVVELPLPLTPEEVTTRVLDAVSARTRIAILDHITSPTALILPLEELVPELRQRGLRVLIDGAHALGQIPVDLSFGPDWYVGNAHKWLYAPRGTALIHAGESVANLTAPTVVSHAGAHPYPVNFDFLGTRDYTAWLTLPAALAFTERLEPERIRAHAGTVIDYATGALADLGATPAGAEGMHGFMRSFLLPRRGEATEAEAEALHAALWSEGVQVMVKAFRRRLLLRISAQVYVDETDIDRLVAALVRVGVPS